MISEVLRRLFDTMISGRQLVIDPVTYQQLVLVAAAYVLARLIGGWLRFLFPALTGPPAVDGAHVNRTLAGVAGLVLIASQIAATQPVDLINPRSRRPCPGCSPTLESIGSTITRWG